MKKILITGGSGFLGEILEKRLLEAGYFCVNIDLEPDQLKHPNLKAYQGDIRNLSILEKIFSEHSFDCIIHLAAILAHAVKDKKFLWESNVLGTKNITLMAKKYHVPQIIFTSSNCLWAKNFGRPVTEEDQPEPVEIYGQSKLAGEKILWENRDNFKVVIFRCPTIIDEGRLGLLAILFEFIDEGRKVWVIGGGKNRYQFIYAQDLIEAIIKTFEYKKNNIFNLGSDHVKSFSEIYQFVIQQAKTKARVATINKPLTLLAMKIAYFFGLSPLGPYQYKMIAEDFEFNTEKIKKELGWSPTLTNEEMLFKAYQYYHEHLKEIRNRHSVSAHKQPAKMGIIKLLKWFS